MRAMEHIESAIRELGSSSSGAMDALSLGRMSQTPSDDSCVKRSCTRVRGNLASWTG